MEQQAEQQEIENAPLVESAQSAESAESSQPNPKKPVFFATFLFTTVF